MYVHVFARYVPVVRILMKKSRNGETQHLNLNVSDFEKAGLARKTGVKFDLKLKNGRSEKVLVSAPAATGFIDALQADETAADLLRNNDYHFALNSKYQLSISCATPVNSTAPEAEVPTAVE